MPMHQASGHWRLGLGLSLATAVAWATLPVALKVTLEQLDALTLTWFRFLVAAVLVGGWLAWQGRLRPIAARAEGRRGLLLIAAVTLVGNYVFYLLGVKYTTPANAQLLIQLAPLLMAVGAIAVFRERFARAQWLGLAVLAAGMLLFFDDQRRGAADAGGYGFGALLVVVAAVSWAAYALVQKQLLVRLDSVQVLGVIYIAATLLLWPLATPSALRALDGLHWALLGYCALNTVAAYGAFAEALAHWEASRVSAVLATTPLLCIAVVAACHALWPWLVAPERITTVGYAGAVLVVCGSAAVSLLGRRAART